VLINLKFYIYFEHTGSELKMLKWLLGENLSKNKKPGAEGIGRPGSLTNQMKKLTVILNIVKLYS